MTKNYNYIIKNTLHFIFAGFFIPYSLAGNTETSTSTKSYELVKTTSLPSDTDLIITKYEYINGVLTPVNYQVTFPQSDIGDTSIVDGTASYYNWNGSAYKPTGTEDDYDIKITANATTQQKVPLQDDYFYVVVGAAPSNDNAGAIYNTEYTSSLSGIFVGNTSTKSGTNNGNANGGGIFNNNVLGEIDALFISNYAQAVNASKEAYGGGLFNNSNVKDATTGIVGIGTIRGDFIANYANGGGKANGGGIYNSGTIGSIDANFYANYASSSSGTAFGGAISNTGSITSGISGSFVSNYVTANTNAFGGAIYNTNTISSIEADFFSNYASGTSSNLGGAIYNAGATSSLTLSATNGNTSYYVGNWAGLSKAEALDKNGGFLYLANGKVNFDTDLNSSIIVGTGTVGYDSIAGASLGTINKDGEGSLIVNSSMEFFFGTLNVNEGKMYYTNSAILGLSSLIIDNAEFITSASVLGSSTSIKEDGILSLFGGVLSNDINTESTANGTVNINSYVELNANIYAGEINVLGNSYLEINDVDIAGKMTIGSNASTNEDDLAYVMIKGGNFSSDINLGSADYAGTARLDITGTVNFDSNADGYITISGENAIGKTVLNILSGFVNANQNDTGDYDLYIKEIDEVTIYGNVDIGEIYIDQSSIGDYAEKEFSSSTLLGDIVNDSTVSGSDYLFLGSKYEKETLLDATITLEDVGNVHSENTIITSDVAYVLNNKNKETSFSGSMNFVDAEGSSQATLKTAIQTDANAIVAGEIVANYDSALLAEKIENGEDISAYLKAIESTDGVVNLADGASVSSTITVGDKTYVGVAITNVHIDDTTGLTVNLEGDASVNGSIVANSPLYIKSDDTTSEGSTLTVAGGTISTSAGTVEIAADTSLVLTTNALGQMAYFENVGEISLSGADASLASISVAQSASMLVGDIYTIADEDTLSAGANADIFENIDYGNGFSYENGTITANSLSYFSSKADNANEKTLALALDSLDNTGDTDAKIDFKNTLDFNGLDSYMMNNYSYITETNSMILSNLNYSNVNRARTLLDNSLGQEDEIRYVSQVDRNKLAQVQSINFLGSKKASNGVAGYDYWSVGSTANIDAVFNESSIVGLSIGGVYNKVKGEQGDVASSNVFLVNAYGVAKSGIYPFEVFTNIGYAHFFNDASKYAAKSSWHSDAFNALVGIAFDFDSGIENLSLRPLAMLNAVILNSENATYSNGVEIEAQNYISAKFMLGLEFDLAISKNFNASLKTIYAYEIADDSYDFSYDFGNEFMEKLAYVGGKSSKHSAILGLGISYDFSDNISAYLDYFASACEKTLTHSLNLSLALKF